MRNAIEKAARWLRSRRECVAGQRRERQERRLRREAGRAVQVMEFEGDVYLSMGGVPLLPLGALSWDMGTTLSVAREAWVHYKGKEDEDGRA